MKRLQTRPGLRARVAPLLALLCLTGAAAPRAGEVPVSIAQIPLEVDLTPLLQGAESALPTQVGSWPAWRNWHGIETRYRAWRGPLQLAMQGEVLQAQAHVRYQLQARKGLIGGLGLSVGCGVDEPPRQALIGLLARLDWGPDWTLRPRFRVLPTRFLDRCEVTLAEIDVSPLVGRIFEERIESSVRTALEALGPRLERLRGEAGRLWQVLQAPRELAPGLWLRIEPLGLALAPLQGAGARVQTAVWLAFRAALAGEAGPVAAPLPLPALVPYSPLKPGLELALEVELDLGRVSEVLNRGLAGQILTLEGRQVRMDHLELGAKGADLILVAELSGEVPGRLTVLARPGFDPVSGVLRLEELGFSFDAEDPDQGLIANLFHDRIRERIESEANRLLAELSPGITKSLEARLAADLPAALAPDLSGLRVTELRIGVRETGLALTGSVAGPLRLGPAASP